MCMREAKHVENRMVAGASLFKASIPKTAERLRREL